MHTSKSIENPRESFIDMNNDFENTRTDFSLNIRDAFITQPHSDVTNGSIGDNAHEFSVLNQNMSLLMNRCEQLQAKLDQNTNTNSNFFDASSIIPTQSNESMEVFKVSTKVPPLYSEKPDLWFHQVEAQFRNNKIGTDQTKYDIVVSNLDLIYLDVVAHIIRNPPDENKYDTFKSTLIA